MVELRNMGIDVVHVKTSRMTGAIEKLKTVIIINVHTRNNTLVSKSDMQLLKVLDNTGLLFDRTSTDGVRQ